MESTITGKMQIVSSYKVFKFKGLCPYCGGDLTYRCTAWVQDDNGHWKSDGSFDFSCSSEPDIDSDDWKEWEAIHTVMPYVHQLPVDVRVTEWINERYRFAI